MRWTMRMALVQIEYTECWNPDCPSRRPSSVRFADPRDLPPRWKPGERFPPSVPSVDEHSGPRRYSGNVCPEDGCKTGFDPARARRWAEPGLILVGDEPPTFEPVVRRKCVNCLCGNLFSETMNACPRCGTPHALVPHCSHCGRKHHPTRLSVWAGIFFYETSFCDTGPGRQGGDSELSDTVDDMGRIDYDSLDDADDLAIGDQNNVENEEPED